jgi:prepilin-type N-terminal cleavage/methylation domain-containing protein
MHLKKMNKFSKNKNKYKTIVKKGYSLVEVLVTMVVLLIGFIMVSMLMTSSIKSTMNSRNQIVASQLSQEGVELMLNAKDSKGETFPSSGAGSEYYRKDIILDPTNANGISNGDYRIGRDMVLVKAASPVASGFYRLKYITNTFTFFSYGNGGSVSRYSRKISVQHNTDAVGAYDGTVTITSMVKWDNSDDAFPTTCTVGSKCVSAKSTFSSTANLN